MYRAQSSNAYVLDPVDRRQKMPGQDEQSKRLSKIKAKKLARRRKFLFFANLALALCVCMSILYGYVQITKISRENVELQKQYEDTIAKNRKLSVDIQAMRDTKVIEDIAVNKLGMTKPEKFQTVYLEIGKTDHVNVTAKNETESEKKGFVAAMTEGFHNLLAYFG